MAARGCYKLVSEPMALTLNHDGPRMWNLESKFPQGFDVQSARVVLRELLGDIGKIKRYIGSIKLAEKGDIGNLGFGTTKIKFGPLDLFGKGQTPHNHHIQSFSSPGVVRYFNRRSSEVPKSRTNPDHPISRGTCPQTNQCSEFR
jgi:hypothetical protein